MKCSSCDAELKPDAKFCGNCGAKVQGGGGQSKGLALAPNPLGLASCVVKVIEITGDGPDKDGDVRVELKYEVNNKTNEDWDYLVVRVQLLDSQGQVVEETRDTQEQTIAAGDSAEFESSLWGVKFKALGSAPEKAGVLVSAIGCALARQKLGEMDVPAEPFQAVQLPRVKVGDVVQLVSGSLWKTEIDSDKDSRIEVKALVQNLTALHLHEVKIIAEITYKAGREITDVNGSDEIRPGDICVISGSGYAKDKLFKGAKIALSLSTYFPVATGIDQHSGIKISAPEVSDQSDDEDDEPVDDDASRDSDRQDGPNDWKINAGWENRDEDKLICRWIVCWKELEDDHIVGAVAGYSGHGAFEVERFYGSLDEGELTSLWVDSTDRVTDEEIDFDELDDDLRAACEAALDCIWEWNDHDIWSETDEVIMRPEMKKSADEEEDMLYYAPDHAEYLGKICELVGLTAGPNASASVNHEDSERQRDESSTRLLYATMKWFEVTDQPDNIDELPEAFAQAKSLWEKNKKGNLPKVLELLSGYVGASFLPSNLDDWEDLFVDPDGGAFRLRPSPCARRKQFSR
jgi:hypothetical protein